MARKKAAGDEREDLTLGKLLEALSDPTRLEIVRRLAEADALCSSFSDLGSKTSLSYHFRILRLVGLTNTEKQGTCRLISLRVKEVERAFPSVLKSILKNIRPRE